ncbi:MAG: hypothetical protein HY799_03605 [Nitrosomonadales bacterium]|nr:hypothetical protein [Nitrosomonadales bacterium]
MSLIDNKSTVDEMSRRAPPSLREDLHEVLEELLAGEYIRDKNRAVAEPKIIAPKITPPKMFVPKPVAPSKTDELDFTDLNSASVPKPEAVSRTMRKTDEAELAKAELEIAMAQSGVDLPSEDEPSKEAQLRAKVAAAEKARSELEAGIDAAKARASADAAAKAEAKARQEADIAARARVVAESKAKQEAANREQAEAKAKLEAAARMRAEQEAARAKAALEVAARSKAEAEARVRAEIEAAARAKQVVEAKAKQEAEAARLKAEQEAARVKAELEAAAKAKAEAEAARIKAELEAAKARAEAEAKALAEALAKQEAEEKARREAEAARLKAEQEAQAMRLKAEQEAAAKALVEAEAKSRAEAEAKARAEAEAKARAEAEAKARAEALARKEAEAAALREAEERARNAAAVVAQEALARVSKEKMVPKSAPAPAFKIDLENFPDSPQPVVSQTASPAVDHTVEAEAKAMQEAKQRAAAEMKADAEMSSKPNMAAEMARLKAEADVARQKADEEARRREEEQTLADEQAKAWAEAEQRAQAQVKIEAEQAVQQAALSQAKAANKSAPRKRRAPLPLGKIVFGLIMLALISVVVLPYVYPLQEYIAPLEQRLSAQLKQPVRIGGMTAASIPPKLQLQNITVGNAQEVKIANIVLNFDLLSLFSEIKVVSDAELNDISIKGNQIEMLAPSLKLVGGDRQFPVRHLSLHRVKFVTDEVVLPDMSGVAELDMQGAFTRIALHSEDDKYNVDLQPDQGRWQLGVNLKETSLPLLPDIVFSDLSAKGILGEGEVNFTEMDAHIYKGILLGSAKLNWRKGWQLQGRLEAKTFELNKMFPKNGVEGELFGEGTFSLSGDKLSQIGGARRLDASFTVKNGEVSAIDMVETARLLSRENLVGGRTRFEDMIGVVQVENGALHFRQLKIVSAMLSASGSFDVSPTDQLSGNFNAEIKMRAGNNQLSLYGTLAEPKLRAGR